MERIVSILSFLLLAAQALALPAADCQFTFSFTVTGQIAPASGKFDNRLLACQQWSYSYSTDRGNAESGSVGVAIEYSEDNIDWSEVSSFTDTFKGGSFTGFYPYMRVKLNTLSGYRRVTGIMYGFRNVARSGSSGASNAYAWFGTLTPPTGALQPYKSNAGNVCNFDTGILGLQRIDFQDFTLSTDKICALETTPPAAPWRAEVGFLIQGSTSLGFPRLGMWARSTAGNVAISAGCAPRDATAAMLEVSGYVLPSAGYAGLDYSSGEGSQCLGNGSNIIFQRIEDNGTDRIWYTSNDRVFWTEQFRVARTQRGVMDRVGVMIHNGGQTNRPLALTVVHWDIRACPCT